MKMKRLSVLVIGCILLFTSFAYAADQNVTTSITKTTVTVPASGVMYSVPVDISKNIGFFSVQSVITGSGTLTVSYQLSNSEKAPYTWSTPVGATAIASGLTAGTYMYQFEPYTIAKWLRLSFTETGASDTVTVVTNMAGQ